ncbi:hypothetical protein SS50377_28045 [Spironucleus salmonicida]|uniref:Uncharacterized protein n=1 Tax=Spironucleus salmonicida TaxID=348837 RepID=V6LPE9_9EUKA|nr:hypothetical protein SS50377_28045 [Spironucleus salmonicida]|eukprot:EST42599.1 Hypothetical protein SS50377_17918 [Spironucleus salmonicida]
MEATNTIKEQTEQDLVANLSKQITQLKKESHELKLENKQLADENHEIRMRTGFIGHDQGQSSFSTAD